VINNISFQVAQEKDVDFIIDTIIEAEKSGTETIISTKIFNFDESQFRDTLKSILLSEIPDFDYSLSSFLIAFIDAEPVGALGAWVEEENGYKSGILKANALFQNISKDLILASRSILEKARLLKIDRTKGAIQLENAYVKSAFRRRGIFTSLIIENIKRLSNGENKLVQAVLFKENYKSFNAYRKLNFNISEEISSDDEIVKSIYPYSFRVLLENNSINFL
jgi:ribosomal protein S18 acetylase RimI-like enzyme